MNETVPEVAAGPPGEVCSGWLGAQAGEGSGQRVPDERACLLGAQAGEGSGQRAPDERACLLKWGWPDGGKDKQKGSG